MTGRIRSIKPEWLDDELLAAASNEARVLSISLILMADDYGNGRASAATIAAETWRYQMAENDGANAASVIDRARLALSELERARFVELYSVSGQRYYSIRNWSKHQKVDRPSKPRVPKPASSGETQSKTSASETLARHSRDTREDLSSHSRSARETLATDQDQEGTRTRDQECTLTPARTHEAAPLEFDSTPFSRRVDELTRSWKRAYERTIGHHPGAAMGPKMAEATTALSRLAGDDDTAFTSLVDAVVKAYFADDFIRSHPKVAGGKNFVDQLDRLIIASRKVNDDEDPPDYTPAKHGQPKSARNYHKWNEYIKTL